MENLKISDEMLNKYPHAKFYRQDLVRNLDVDQTMYDFIKNHNLENMGYYALGYKGRNITYKDMYKTIDRLASAYSKQGVRKDDIVGVCSINTPEFFMNVLALNKIGAVAKLIDLRAKEKDMIEYINEGNCKYLSLFSEVAPLVENIIDETDLKKVLLISPYASLPAIPKALMSIKEIIDGKKKISDDRFIAFNDFVKLGDKNSTLEGVSYEKERPTIIVQSSGSTGKAKSIVHTDFNINKAAWKLAHTDLPLYPKNTMLVTIPPFIIYGFANSTYTALALGMKAELCPEVNDQTVYNNLGKFNVSFAAPLHYRYLKSKIEELKREGTPEAKRKLEKIVEELHKTDGLVSGGDKVSLEEIIEWQQLFKTPVINGYGNNEVVGAAVVTPMYANKPGKIGIPLPGNEIKIIDPETGLECGVNEPGELCIKADNAFKKYMNNEEETKKIKQIHEDGEYVHMGDLCVMDEDGYITIKGRTRRLIIKEAFKISPDTIENTIAELPFVNQSVVVGVPDPVSLSVPMAFVELNEEGKKNIDEAMEIVKKKCVEELKDYEIPTYFKAIDKIPYTPNNKHDFRKLEEMGKEFVEQNEVKLTLKK